MRRLWAPVARRAWHWLQGFALGAYPPAGVLLAAAGALPRLLRVAPGERLVLWSLVLYALERAWLQARGGGSPAWGAAGALLAWFLFKATGRGKVPRLAAGLACGLALTFGLAAFEVLNDPGWTVYGARANGGPLNGRERLVPSTAAEPYAYRPLGAPGVGLVLVRFEMRSDRPSLVRVSLNHPALPNGGRATILRSRAAWTPYELTADLPRAGTLVLAVGGQGGWPPDLGLEFRKLSLEGSFGVRGAATVSRRAAVWAFNPNALGLGAAALAAAVAGAPVGPAVRAGAVVAGIGIVGLSGSRGAAGALLVALVLAVGLAPMRRRLRGLALLAVVSLAVILASRPELAGRLGTALDPRAATTVQRFTLYNAAARAFAASPLFGVGPLDRFIAAAIEREGAAAGLSAADTRHVHSLWLQTAAESGAVGLAVLVLVWAAALRAVVVRRDRGAAMVMGAVAFGVTFDYLWQFAPVYAAFWMSAGGAFGAASSGDASLPEVGSVRKKEGS